RGRDRYRVSTATATIGIRGTHYWLVTCRQDCRNRDGTLAPDGDYGLVREGRVAIAPLPRQAGSAFGTDRIMHVQAPEPAQPERQFGADQVFHVAAATGQASELIGPPPFLFAPLGVPTAKPVVPGAPPGTAGPKVDPVKPAPALAAPEPVLAPTGERG